MLEKPDAGNRDTAKRSSARVDDARLYLRLATLRQDLDIPVELERWRVGADRRRCPTGRSRHRSHRAGHRADRRSRTGAATGATAAGHDGKRRIVGSFGAASEELWVASERFAPREAKL